ncbi:MAG: HlyD family efflux transporter periplasmic adaptor subunit [Roseibium sp.]
MDIIHERPSQRLHYRVSAPMRVTLDEQSYDAVDWGLGGCRLKGLSCSLPEVGSVRTLFCTLPFQGFNITLKAEAEVVRCFEDSQEVAFRFVHLGERETALMQHFVEDLVRGKMTDVADTIVRIDTPVTPVPTKPDPNPIRDLPTRRWPIKQIVMTLLYVFLGLGVFGYVAIYIFATLFRLEVSTAVVSADRVEIKAPVAGRMTLFDVRPGDVVTAGSILARFENKDLAAEIRQAETSLMQAEAELSEHRLYLKTEEEREEGYSLVAANNLRQAQAETAALEFAVNAAKDQVARYLDLFNQGYLQKDVLSSAQLELATAQSALQQHLIHIVELEQLGNSRQSIGILNGNRFSGLKSERTAEVARWQQDVNYRRALLERLRSQPSEIVIKAPFDGIVIQSDASENEVLKPGALVAILQKADSSLVTAFLTQEEISQLRVASPARVYVPGEDRWIEAKVTSVNRTDGFVDEITQVFRFRAPDSRSARTEVTVVSGNLPPPGTPVTVYFERYRANTVLRTVSGFFRSSE